MATNKFILVPEDIYRGLTSEDTGNINLDYTKRALENVKREKTDPATKYARYNQELRKYLHLKKEHDEKPVRVEVTNATPQVAPTTKTAKTKTQTTAPGTAPGTSQTVTAAIFQPKTPASELFNEINLRVNTNPEAYNITNDGKIKNEHGRALTGSNVQKSIHWIINQHKGTKPRGPRPPGTINLENRLYNDEILKKMFEDVIKGSVPQATSTPKRHFKPQSWK